MIDLNEVTSIKNKLDEHPDKYLEIIEDTKLAICITNEKGLFVAVNNNYSKMYGYPKDKLVGHSFLTVVPDKFKEKLQDMHDIFVLMKDEIMRNWEVQDSSGRVFRIFADAGYSEKLIGKPTKITFVWPNDEEKLKILGG